MNEHDEYLRQRGAYCGPLTLRDFMRHADWWVIATIIAVSGFWAWVGYNVAQWWP